MHSKWLALNFLWFISAGMSAFGQAPHPVPDLTSPSLRPHGDIWRHNSAGMPIVETLNTALRDAPARGITNWKGVTFHSSAGSSSLAGVSDAQLVEGYQKLTCVSDAVVIGRVGPSRSHLSASGTAIYTDYIFTVDTVLKHPLRAPKTVPSHIIVTRLGGSLVLPAGPATFLSDDFPPLQSGATYLQFLSYLPTTEAFRPSDDFSSLVASSDGTRWLIDNTAGLNRTPTELGRGTLEALIPEWTKACK
jgi:hypothetical protein